MSVKSGIEWTNATWNPVTGCTKVSQGCKNCYAERMWPRLAAPRAKANIYTGRDFTDVRCHPEKLDIPLRWTKPRRIFVNSMSDLFHEDVPFRFIDKVFAIMAMTSGHGRDEPHIFQILTKRPKRMLEYMTMPTRAERVFDAIQSFADASNENERAGCRYAKSMSRFFLLQNVWLGVSVEDQSTADERIPLLLQTPAAVRWISAEPLLGHVSLTRWIHQIPPGPLDRNGRDGGGVFSNINWLVAGGESGPRARPMHPDWVRSLRDQCQAASVPFFFKQWGEWVPVCAQYPATDAEHDETERAGCVGDIALEPDGVIAEGFQPRSNRTWLMDRVGKKAAGRMLEGRTWDEYPASC